MSVLPRQIQAQLEEAERLQQALSEPEAAVEQPVEPQEATPPQPPEPVVTQPDPEVKAVESKTEDAEYWRQRFKTMEGMNRQLQQDLRQIQEQVQAIRQQPAPQAQAPAAKPLVTDEDEAKFGADMIEVMRRVVQEQAKPFAQHLQQLDTMVRNSAPAVERNEKDLLQVKERTFYDTLVREVPDWEEVDKSPGWLQWLDTYDPIVGGVRQVSLDAASGSLDANRVIGMFKLYKSTLAPAAPAAPAQTARDVARAELASQVAPAKSSRTTVQPQAQKTYTGADYQYWTDHRRVHDTDAGTIQANLNELEKAFAENRITW